MVDTYHVWWDAQLAADIARAAGRIVSYQLCDWVLPLPPTCCSAAVTSATGTSTSGAITAHVLAAGYTGYAEVEIFNQTIWDMPGRRNGCDGPAAVRPASGLTARAPTPG